MSRLFLTLSSSYFWYFSVLGLCIPFLAVFLDGRGFNSVDIGEILAIFTATKIVGPTFWAFLADKSGKQLPIIQLGSCLAFLCFSLLFWVQGYWPISFSLALFSVFWTAILPQFEVMTLVSIRRSAKIYARIRLWGSVGFIAIAIIAGEVIEYFDPDAFIWLGFIILLALWLSTLLLKQPHMPISAKKNTVPIIKKIIDKNFIYFFIAGLCLQVSFGPYYSFFALFVRDAGYPSYAVGLFIGISVAAEIGIFLILGHIFKRFSLRTILSFSIIVTGVRWYLTGEYIESLPVMALAQLAHACSFGLYHSASIQFLQNHFEANQQNRGQAIYIAGVYGVGGALGAVVAGRLWLDGLGATQAYNVACVVALLGGMIMLLLPKRSPYSRAKISDNC